MCQVFTDPIANKNEANHACEEPEALWAAIPQDGSRGTRIST
jgi:hypothetical protein